MDHLLSKEQYFLYSIDNVLPIIVSQMTKLLDVDLINLQHYYLRDE